MMRGVFILAKRLRLSIDGADARVTTDAMLLNRFLNDRDESAFTQLLERHATLVWGVCRRGLNNHLDAEDAFQATFLVLFQQAKRIRKQQSVASWLHGVAWRIARKMRRSEDRRRQREHLLAHSEAQNSEMTVDRSMMKVMDAELARLPMRYREPILLCYLQGQSHATAAQTLGWPVGTVAGRLSRAKQLLRSRLIRRGVAPSVAATFGVELARAQVPAGLLEKTLQTIQTGGAIKIALLTKGAVGTMLLTKWLLAGVVGVGLTLAAGVGYSAWQGRKDNQEQNASVISSNEEKRDHPDYQLIQGHWRWGEGIGAAPFQEDLIFEGDTFIRKKQFGGNGPENATKPERFVLKPDLNPKQLVLFSSYQLRNIENVRKQFGGWGAQADLQRLGEERRLCTYDIKGDELTVRTGPGRSGFVPYKLGNDGKVFADQSDPRATFPKLDDPNVNVKIYRRVADDSDYQKIQGRWRIEEPPNNQGRVSVQDIIFHDKKYTQQGYFVGSKSEFSYDQGARDFILDPNRKPKRMELVLSEPKTSVYQGNDRPIGEGVPERMLCNYQLTDDTLTVEYEAYIPLRRDANRNIYSDRDNPKSLGDKAYKKVYHRVTPNSNSLVDRQVAQVDAERKLADERIAALDERFKLEFQAYKAGKEPLNLVLDSIRDRLDSKIERAGMDQGMAISRFSITSQQQIQNAVKEALESAKEVEELAVAKNKSQASRVKDFAEKGKEGVLAQGVIQDEKAKLEKVDLDRIVGKTARMDYELRLLRLEKSRLEKQPK